MIRRTLFLTFLFTTFSLLAVLQAQRINPAQQINWPQATGSGAPTAPTWPCAPANYGQPYTDVAPNPNVNYTCGAHGWAVTGAGAGSGCLGGNTIANGCTAGTTKQGAATNIVDDSVINPQCVGSVCYVNTFAGADGGAKIAACFAALSLTQTTCDASNLGSSFSSSTTVIVPAYTTLYINGTLTFSSGQKLTVSAYGRLTGPSIATASIVGNLNGDVLDATAGNAYVDGISTTNNDTSDTAATAAHFGLDQNIVGTLQTTGGGTNALQIDPGYYSSYWIVISNPSSASSNALYMQGANATIFHYFHSNTTGTCIAIDNTNGFYFDYLDCENSTTEEMYFGNLVNGPVSGTINGGYVEPGTGHWDVYYGSNAASGKVVSNNVTYWGYSTGCGPVANSCIGRFITIGSSPSANSTGLDATTYNGIGGSTLLNSQLGILQLQGEYGSGYLWADSPNSLSVITNVSGHGRMDVGSLWIGSPSTLDPGFEVIPNTATGFHGTNGINVQFSDGTGASAHLASYASDGSLTDGGAVIANIQITTGTTAVPANTCTTNTPTTMTGLLTTSSIIPPAPTTSTAAVTGWGAVGGLSFTYYPTANTFNWSVCNTTATSITPGGSLTWNVGAR